MTGSKGYAVVLSDLDDDNFFMRAHYSRYGDGSPPLSLGVNNQIHITFNSIENSETGVVPMTVVLRHNSTKLSYPVNLAQTDTSVTIPFTGLNKITEFWIYFGGGGSPTAMKYIGKQKIHIGSISFSYQ